MSQLRYLKQSATLNLRKVSIRAQLLKVVKLPKPMNVVFVLLPLCALILWSISLKEVDLQRMNDLGLVSVLPPSIIIALITLTISFCLALRRPQMRQPVLLLHLVLLVVMLYSITTLVEEAPHISTVYKDTGYTEYITRTGTVNPYLDFYFNYPGFFILSAIVTRVAGYHDTLGFAAWTPVFFNLIYLGPLYMIFTSATTDKRVVWLGLWFFALTNWVQQDSFVPQGLDFFLYLVIIAILLRWFKVPPIVQSSISKQRGQRLSRFLPFMQRLYAWLTAPDTLYTSTHPRHRIMLLISLVAIFAFIVSSHPLTPFFVLVSVSALVIFRRCNPRWLPVLMALMTGAWIYFMTQPYLAGHLNQVIGDVGHINNSMAVNVTSRASVGDPEHVFIANMRIIMPLFIWSLAFAGAVFRLRRGYQDITYLLLAIAPFSLILLNSYGGEMLLRIYLFSLPPLVFFAAGLFYSVSTSRMLSWHTVVVSGMSIILLGGFLFTRYGNERIDYFTYAELDGIRYLYSVAPSNSLFLTGADDGPLQFQDYEKYSIESLADLLPDAEINKNVDAIVQFIENQKHPRTYLIFTRSQKAWAYSFIGLPPGTLERLEDALLKSGKFMIIYSNHDAQIIEYIGHSNK